MTYRIFQGNSTQQLDLKGQPAIAEAWYWEPLDYEGGTLYDRAFSTEAEADAAAWDEIVYGPIPRVDCVEIEDDRAHD